MPFLFSKRLHFRLYILWLYYLSPRWSIWCLLVWILSVSHQRYIANRTCSKQETDRIHTNNSIKRMKNLEVFSVCNCLMFNPSESLYSFSIKKSAKTNKQQVHILSSTISVTNCYHLLFMLLISSKCEIVQCSLSFH